jgi:hypothetical protein
MLQMHDLPRCHAAGKPAIYTNCGEIRPSNVQGADKTDIEVRLRNGRFYLPDT